MTDYLSPGGGRTVVCLACGSVVMDRGEHDEFHAFLNTLTELLGRERGP